MSTFSKLFVWFVLYSFVGWSYESALYSVRSKKFVDSGMLRGCRGPIYGVGALVNIAIFADIESYAAVFFGAALSCCVIEYAASWLIEQLYGARRWDYGGWPLNINGRVCPLAGGAFGLLALVTVKYIHPRVENLTDSCSPVGLQILAAVLFVLFVIDVCASISRCKNLPKDDDEVKIIFKLSYDFIPKINGREIASAIYDGGCSFFDFIREFVREKVAEISDWLGR